MSALKPGTLCVIVAGCPENIGLIVRVVRHLGARPDREDAYLIATVSGRQFPQLWSGKRLLKGDTTEAITDRYKLRPLVGPMEKRSGKALEVPPPPVRQRSKAVSLNH